MNGKGSKRRPTRVSYDQYSKNWDAIFGRKTEAKPAQNKGLDLDDLFDEPKAPSKKKVSEDSVQTIKHGFEVWRNSKGNFHREDGPAYIDPHGTQSYYQNGELHRIDGPATIYLNGMQYFYKNGQKHRTDGPAIICPDGYQEYYQNGKRHREDGPAVIWPDGKQEYWQNGELHRTDGPAISRPNGYQEYWIDGNKLTEEEFNSRSVKTIEHGHEIWRNLNGELHRTNGPAIILPNGTKEYYLNGKLHREDGPAVIYPDGKCLYYQNGKKLTNQECCNGIQ